MIRQASAADIEEVVAIDDDACAVYDQAGLHFDFGPEHPFALSERARWAVAVRAGDAFIAETPDGRAAGMLVMTRVDGAPYLEQISVRTSAMRRGIGRRLLTRAIEWAAGQPLWLTTYAHVPWNRPFYESAGFEVVPERECPPEIVEALAEQRRWLPDPRERIAMRRPGEPPKSAAG